MDIRNIQYRLRRRRLDEIFDFAALLMRTHLRAYLLIAAPLIAVFFTANSALIYTVGAPDDGVAWENSLQFYMILLVFAQCTLLSLPLTLLNGRLLFEDRPSLRRIWRESVQLLPLFFWKQVAVRLTWIVPLFITLIGPYRALIHNFFQNEALTLERLRGKQLNVRLGAMAAGLAERSFAFLLIAGPLYFLMVLIVWFSWNNLLGALDLEDRFWWLDAQYSLCSPIVNLATLCFAVYHNAARFLYYVDSRSLREGWDVELALVKGLRDTDEARAAR